MHIFVNADLFYWFKNVQWYQLTDECKIYNMDKKGQLFVLKFLICSNFCRYRVTSRSYFKLFATYDFQVAFKVRNTITN